MAIRFDASYNKRIQNIVANYNKRRSRMINAGFKHVPEKVKISELKSLYTTRRDLNRELNRLKNINYANASKKIANQAGAKLYQWEYIFAKTNVKNAIEYFVKERQRVSKRVARFPGERQYVDNIQAKIDLLNKNIEQMSDTEFKSAVASINEYTNSPTIRTTQYRNFLSEVDWVMQTLNIPEKERDAFFKKFEELTPSQFLYAYDNNDLISRVYELYLKAPGDEPILNTSEMEAEEMIKTLMEEADQIVIDAKLNAD